ncbi:MAG: hypothetical protein COA94_02085 [Rickettsiales bacterium]|nr:MAG: hypothetical protein COA94_02085 [Rickettsiales bacterium]
MSGGDESENLSFSVTFFDGYSFRNMVEYIRSGNKVGYFIFSKTLITYIEQDNTGIVLNKITIKTDELVEYVCNSETPIYVGLNFDELRSFTKPIKKKDSIKLYKIKNKPTVYIEVLSGSNSHRTENVASIRISNIEKNVVYTLPESTNSKASCVISSTNFSLMCSGMSTIKSGFVEITNYSKGMKFKACVGTGLSERLTTFGIINEEDRVSESDLQISMLTIKYLSKLPTLCNTGTMKLYTNLVGCLLIRSHIGTFGEIDVYIKLKEKK